MTDLGITAIVLAVFALTMAFVASRYPRTIRPWLWIAFAEYFACAVIQYPFGIDARTYRQDGLELAHFLDVDFDWASRELGRLLFQQPSTFDRYIEGAGSNTGSMSAASGWLIFIVRGSPYAEQALMAGLSMFGAIAIFDVLRDECPRLPPFRLLMATVLFPSIAFWTATLHKEAFCIMGIGLVLCAWRAARHRKARALVYGGLGLTLIALFRAPALAPLLLGLLLYFVIERVRKGSGREFAVLGPFYLLAAFAMLAVGMILLTRVSPNLALDKLGDSVELRQQAWSRVEGGSSFEMNAPALEDPVLTQLVMSPLALFNATLRPQLFDVRNPLMLISALEMTVIAVLLVRALMLHGASGVLRQIQLSPFLTMCAVITVVGLTFVGLTTRNYGSLARYRVPFLPFYGSLLAVLNLRVEQHRAGPKSTTKPTLPASDGTSAGTAIGRRRTP